MSLWERFAEVEEISDIYSTQEVHKTQENWMVQKSKGPYLKLRKLRNYSGKATLL